MYLRRRKHAINYFEKDLSTRCITIYLEAVSDGSEFIKAAQKVTKTKPIVCFKAGKTEKGMQAVASVHVMSKVQVV